MKLIALSIVLAGAFIAAALYFSPASQMRPLYGDGYIYVIDLKGKNIANIIPGKTRMENR